jgi:hypothetical protein
LPRRAGPLRPHDLRLNTRRRSGIDRSTAHAGTTQHSVLLGKLSVHVSAEASRVMLLPDLATEWANPQAVVPDTRKLWTASQTASACVFSPCTW